MAVFLLKLSINYTDEIEEGIYHCRETRESVDVGIRQRVAWAAIRGRRREIKYQCDGRKWIHEQSDIQVPERKISEVLDVETSDWKKGRR
jgi:hypothetical protein